ncbi:hypothetical protein HAV15_012550 [Penicillium sp. str. |nr:hypothetical protein HAV15_012550 [Penicillium sp. str. \
MGRRWQNPGGWGARHILDTAPFTLWDDLNCKYRPPTKEEYQWIDNKFEYRSITISGWYIRIETNNPPNPVPLTVGCKPAIFIGINETFPEPLPKAPYSNPRIQDPCPHLHLPRMEFPTDVDNVTLLKALKPLANVRAVVYLPLWTVVELEYGDNRVYERMSLPGIVAGRTTMYHHVEAPFYSLMKDLTATRQLDLAQQEEPPRRLLQGKDIKPGSWAEVRCMSSGLVSLISYGKLLQKPVSGYIDIPFDRWHSYNLQACWGVGDEAISDGIGGAPIVSCENGGVTGFFHLFDGRNCLSAHLDELVAEGWEVV